LTTATAVEKGAAVPGGIVDIRPTDDSKRLRSIARLDGPSPPERSRAAPTCSIP
jgi:hypothetical protein